ncbi:DUF4670 domain-containing protein [Methylobacillus arboreus]|uniref:DUF4670 domain-containing protein n=1 Tax=Methylobacillus arboreus TaxID=755170 RepID=UPI001E2FF49F|nr:DUF4670 domain-containing protein [Methylobacillus arboreus]MCB5189924.1 DUF4670 domain-containing protein [Methylobacillus arboreus]
MANAESITTLPNGYPCIAIPDDFKVGDWGSIYFDIDTPLGKIRVSSSYGRLTCTASPNALISAGLLLPDWLPGFAGNNKSTQLVVFTPHGPILIFGNQRGFRVPYPSLQVRGKAKSNISFTMPATKQQAIFLKEQRRLFDEQQERAREVEARKNQEKQRTEERKKKQKLPLQEVKANALFAIETYGGAFLRLAQDDTRFIFTGSAQAEILRHLSAIKQIVQKGESYKLNSSALSIVRS